jgi:hypothetical protein
VVQLALGAQDSGEVMEAPGGERVVGAQAGLADGKGALMQAAGTVEVALGAEDFGEAAEALGRVGVVGA